MGRYLGIPLLTLAALLNATAMAELRIGGGSPDLVLLLVLAWAIVADLRDAMIWAVFGGIMQDLLSVAPLGASSLGLVVVAFAVDSVFGEMQRPGPLITLLIAPPLAMAATVVYHLILLGILGNEGYSYPLLDALGYVTLPAMFYNALFCMPVLWLMARLNRALQPRRVRLE